jgi:hypothetical protein
MPVRYRYAPDGILVVRFLEPVTFEEWRTAFDAVLADPAYSPDVRILSDRRAAGPLNREFVERLIDTLLDSPALLARHPVAIVVTPEQANARDMGRLQELLLKNSAARIRTFDSYLDALAWLKSQPSGGTGPPKRKL